MSTVEFERAAPASQDGGESSNAFVRKMSGMTFLSDNDADALAAIVAQARHVPARSNLGVQGEALQGAFVFLEGFACRNRVLADGRRQISALLLPGDLCDLDCAFLARADHAISTLTPCRVARVSADQLTRLVEEHSSVGSALRLAKLAEEATLREWLVSLGCRSAYKRLAQLFCEILSRLQAVGLASKSRCEMPMTQAGLGEITGLSSVHVNRSIRALREAGLLRLERRTLHVLDLPRLQAIFE